MLRKGIAAYITENSDWRVASEAEGIQGLARAVECAGKLGGDTIVAVVDVQLSGGADSSCEGFEAVRLLAEKGIPSVIFSSHDTGACIEWAMGAGAKGFVSKVSDERILLEAINAVANGKTYIQPDLIAGLLSARSLLSMPTKREKQVVNLIQEGLTNEEIADRMGIKVTTLENYITVIYDKTGSRDRTSLLEKLR